MNASRPGGKVYVDGKFFARNGTRFPFRGVTYGTFAPRGDGAMFPERERVKRDFESMREAGFTVVRTYAPPPDDVLDVAADWGLRILVGIDYADWRILVGTSRRERHRITRDAAASVRAHARRLRDRDEVLGVVVGNEIPADVVRWLGTGRVSRDLRSLIDVVRDEDPEQLVTYANFPTTEYLPLEDVDFAMFNVFLHRPADLRRYLTRLHHIAGDRPLVLGEIGADAGTTIEAEEQQAALLEHQLMIAVERGVAGWSLFSWTDEWWVDAPVEAWHFGLTRLDRSPRPSLAVASRWNHIDVPDLSEEWPSASVVICAYNAAATLEECLEKTCAMEYPNYEVVVVDDGSTDATAEIARRFPRVRLLTIEHAGLSVARNEGYRAASHELIAYLDSDAYPTEHWLYYLVLGMEDRTVAGVGGPNVPPPDDPDSAQRVAQAPGGPLHVLLSDDRAEHVPGCNMAFWRYALEEVGGFDPIYTAAGDDVDVCWKVLDRGYDIAFHPAALVWHHRRPGLRTYLRQQRGYGKAEALVEARHPDRFTPAGSARWRGRIYSPIARLDRQRIYRGVYGTAGYQSIYRSGGYLIDLAHQVGIPVSAMLLLTAPFAFIHAALVLPAAFAALAVVALGVIDAMRARPPRGRRRRRIAFRAGVAILHLLQPLARAWGRMRHAALARRDLPPLDPLPGPITRHGRTLIVPLTEPKAPLTAQLVATLRRPGVRIGPVTGWEDHDARFAGSLLVAGELLTSASPQYCLQVRVRRRLRLLPAIGLGTMMLFAAAVSAWPLVLGAVGFAVVDLTRGVWATGGRVRRLLMRSG